MNAIPALFLTLVGAGLGLGDPVDETRSKLEEAARTSYLAILQPRDGMTDVKPNADDALSGTSYIPADLANAETLWNALSVPVETILEKLARRDKDLDVALEWARVQIATRSLYESTWVCQIGELKYIASYARKKPLNAKTPILRVMRIQPRGVTWIIVRVLPDEESNFNDDKRVDAILRRLATKPEKQGDTPRTRVPLK